MTPGKALNLIRKNPAFSQLNDSSFAVDVVNRAVNMMWGAYPWRQSLVELPPFYMTPNEPDHITPDIQIPVDYQGLEKAWIVDFMGNEIVELKVKRNLFPSPYEDMPRTIAWLPETNGFRLHPTPAPGYGATQYMVKGVYKKTAPVFTDTTLNDTQLPFEALFDDAVIIAHRYAYRDLLGDPNAGSVQFASGRPFYSGELGKFHAAMTHALGAENMLRGENSVSPQDSLEYGL